MQGKRAAESEPPVTHCGPFAPPEPWSRGTEQRPCQEWHEVSVSLYKSGLLIKGVLVFGNTVVPGVTLPPLKTWVQVLSVKSEGLTCTPRPASKQPRQETPGWGLACLSLRASCVPVQEEALTFEKKWQQKGHLLFQIFVVDANLLHYVRLYR